MARGRGDGPRRPRHFLERPLPWGILTLVLLVLVAGGALLEFDQIRSSGGASGRAPFYLITILGVIALLLILSTFFYTLRKRRRGLQEHMPGSMMAWFKSHVYLGLLALLVAVVHVLTRPISSGLTTGKLALIVFAILVVSGIAWRVVYLSVPRRVAGTVGNLAVIDTEKRLGEIHVEIDKVTAGKSPQFQQIARTRLQSGSSTQIQQQAAALMTEERADWVNVSSLADERDQLLSREKRQHRYERILQRWKLLHIPLAVILLGLIAVHIADVFGAGRAAFGGKANQFPSSRACASCHSDVVRQWHQSVMSHGVTSPLMIAQVALAVKENEAAGHPLGTICTACHGPIGTQLTNKATLPFKANEGSPLDPEGGSPHDLILNEGVSCIICHALDTAPQEGSGLAPLPVNKSGLSSLGVMHGPALPGGDPIPVPDHQIVPGGYMGVRDAKLSDEVTTSTLCGACHVVAVDLNGDDKINRKLEPGKQPDLVLQTTYQEWEEWINRQTKIGGQVLGCVACHAPATPGPIVDSAPFGQSPPVRVLHNHSFVGVDYDLTPGHPGLSKADFDQFQEERTNLLRSAVGVVPPGSIDQAPGFFIKRIKTVIVNGTPQLEADVEVKNLGDGHTLPTGFAFVRQMWIEVSAKDTDTGNTVCLANVTFAADGRALKSPCASGQIASAQTDLAYCDQNQLAKEFPKTAQAGALGNDDIVLAKGAGQPPGTCDPWLVSWQKLLTDGSNPLAGNGKINQPRHEVAFQLKIPDIVAVRTRIAGPELVSGKLGMVPMDAPGEKFSVKKRTQGDTEIWPYFFKVKGLAGDTIEVTASLHFRHTSPYFLRALDGFYPPGITAPDLIKNLVQVTMARSTKSTKA